MYVQYILHFWRELDEKLNTTLACVLCIEQEPGVN